jgi:hypothetical protein
MLDINGENKIKRRARVPLAHALFENLLLCLVPLS